MLLHLITDRHFPGGYLSPVVELNLLLWVLYMRINGVTALSSGHFSKISFTIMYVCFLGNILVLSTVNLRLVLIWLQKNAPNYSVKVES